MNKIFVEDYRRFLAGRSDENDIILLFFRLIKNHELRFLFIGRLFEKYRGGGFILKCLLNRYRRRYGLEIAFKKGQIGPGLRLIHPWNITVNDNAILGNNITLYKGCTIGEIKQGLKAGNPTICDNCTLYANSTVCGNIIIGENSVITANSFVNFDVPSNSIVIGNPGVIHKNN